MGSHAVLIPGGHWYLYYSNKLNDPDQVVHMTLWQFSVWREICFVEWQNCVVLL